MVPPSPNGKALKITSKTGFASDTKRIKTNTMADETTVVTPTEVITPVVTPEVDIIAQKDAEIAKLTEERENYKTVALKRLGKLPGDAEFIQTESGLSVEEQVKQALLDQEIARTQKEKDAEISRVIKENAELRLVVKNQPSSGAGSGSSSTSVEVKDSVFSETQLADLRKRAERLKADPEQFIANAKANFRARGF